MRKRSELGSLVCPICRHEVKKRHPAQVICGDHECRKASKRKYYGVTFLCVVCGDETPRKRDNQRFCSAATCQSVSKKGRRAKKVKVKVTCPYCEKTVVARNTRQVTCGSDVCKATRQRAMCDNARPSMRTRAKRRCRFCRKRFTAIAVNHVTCGSTECRKARHKVRDNESFWLKRRRDPVVCGVCDRPIKVKRFRLHPDCSKQLIADKKRLRRIREKLTAAKVAAYKQQKHPKQRDRISPRMEELKCVSQLQRTS